MCADNVLLESALNINIQPAFSSVNLLIHNKEITFDFESPNKSEICPNGMQALINAVALRKLVCSLSLNMHN